MTALAIVSEAEDWWATVLRGAIRDEFAVDRYFARPGELLFGADVCQLTDCAYPAYRAALGLCPGHAKQFSQSSVGAVTDWVARSEQSGGPIRKRNRRPILNCAVAGCPRSVDAYGLCAGHQQRWRRARPKGIAYESFVETTPATFLESYGAQTPLPGSCGVASCAFPRRPRSELCDHHHAQFRTRQTSHRGDDYSLADFEMWIEQPGAPVYNVAGFGSPLREELQFALQCRSDERRATVAPGAFPAIRQLMLGSSRSLLELDPDDSVFRVRYAGRFLTYARRKAEGLRDSATNVSEWERDVWRIERLPGVQPAAAPRSCCRLSSATPRGCATSSSDGCAGGYRPARQQTPRRPIFDRCAPSSRSQTAEEHRWPRQKRSPASCLRISSRTSRRSAAPSSRATGLSA